MGENEFAGLHTNQRLFLEELAVRGVEIEVLVPELELVEARYGEHVELILDRDSSLCSYPSCVVCANKYLTKKLLQRRGICVPKGEQFFPDQIDDAISYAKTLRFPLVIKPSIGSHGDGCYSDLDDEHQVRRAIDQLVARLGSTHAFLIEEQMPGMEFRVFITKNGDYAILHRDPASVVGDGIHTIQQLAEQETERRKSPRKNCLCPIQLDDITRQFLAASGLTLTSVPKSGAKVYLRRNSNIAHGGNCQDYTKQAHASVVEIASRALAAVRGLPYAGVDILSTDITKQQEPGHYCVLEVNSNPGVHMHMRPGVGQGQNVAAYLADMVFPETALRHEA